MSDMGDQSLREKERYWDAVEFLRGCKYVCQESYGLMASIFGVPRATVEYDIKFGRHHG